MDDETEHLEEDDEPVDFETWDLLDAVDQIDAVRGHLNDQENYAPPEIRTQLLKLHQLAMHAVNYDAKGERRKMLDLALDLSDQVTDIIDHLEKVQQTLHALLDRFPDQED
jgi:hypothetical protein